MSGAPYLAQLRPGRPYSWALVGTRSEEAPSLGYQNVTTDGRSDHKPLILFTVEQHVLCRDGDHSHLSPASEGRGATDGRTDLFRPAEAPAPRHQRW